MRLLAFWEYLQPYHYARGDALIRRGESAGDQVWVAGLRHGAGDFHAYFPSGRGESGNYLLPPACTPAGTELETLARVLTTVNPDVVGIIGYERPYARQALRWCRRHGRVAVLMLETQRRDGPRRWLKETLKRWYLTNYDAIIAGGHSHARYARILGFPKQGIFGRYDVVDNTFFGRVAEEARRTRAETIRKLELPESYLLGVGRLIPKKNFAGLIRVYGRVVKAGRDLPRLVIVGAGPEAQALGRLRAELGLDAHVIFRDYAEPKAIAQYMALAKLVIVPSIQGEQWGLVVNEAMACGAACLVSRICGCFGDLIDEGVTGFGFNAADEDSFAAKLEYCCGTGPDLGLIGRNAIAHVAEYSPEAFAAGFMAAARFGGERGARRSALWRCAVIP